MKYLITIFSLFFVTNISYGQHLTSDTCKLYIPKTINQDYIKEHGHQFKIKSNCNVVEFEISIYNRWGKKMYSSNSFNDNWDISKVDAGVHFWPIKELFSNIATTEQTGSIHLDK
ncbi:MAG: gliding motility-associated C-terminal domain-containing protein [Flavobacteriales bacterium]